MSPNYTESQQKEIAAQAALKYVTSNSVVGLGSGSTAEKFINLLGTAVKEGHLENIKVVSSSKKSAALAEALHLTVFEPEAVTDIDLNVDGTDETETQTGFTVKGGGNALHREKMIALKSKRNIFIAEEKKAVDHLGAFGLPIEIGTFDPDSTLKRVQAQLPEQATIRLKKDYEELVYTDNGNLMAHIDFKDSRINNASTLLKTLKQTEGVFSVGLFLNLAERLIIGKVNGETQEFVF